MYFGIISAIVMSGVLLIYLLIQPPHRLTYIVIISAVLLPDVQLLSGLPAFRVEEILIFFFVPYYILAGRYSVHQHANPLFYFFWAFAVAILVSIWHATIILGIPFVIRDTFNAVQMLKYSVLVFLVSCGEWDRHTVQQLIVILMVSFIISALLGIQQRWNLLGINSQMANLYTSGEFRAEKIIQNGRVFGTSLHPNAFGSLMIMGAFWGMSYGMEKIKNIQLSLLSFATIIFCVAALILTGSRTSLIAFGVSFGAGIVLILGTRSTSSLRTSLSLIVLTILLVFVFSQLRVFVPYLDNFDEVLFDPTTDGSYTARWQGGLSRAIEIWKTSPLFGWGPAKTTIRGLSDSEYYLILTRYGLVGFSLMFFFIIIPIRKAFHIFLSKDSSQFLGFFVIVNTIAMLIINLGNVTFSRFQYMDIWVPIVTVLFLYNQHVDDNVELNPSS